MPLPEIIRRRAEQLVYSFCEMRVPKNVRDQYRLEFQIRGNFVTLYECHAPWHPALDKWSRVPSAQFRWDAERLRWTLYWADRNGRWHVYDDLEPSPNITQLLAEVNADPTGIFFG